MFGLSFKFNPEYFKQHLEQSINRVAEELRNHPTKMFTIEVDSKEYLIRYEVEEGSVQFYVQNEESDPRDLIRPDSQLNIGALFFPESMTLPDQQVGLNLDVAYNPVKEQGTIILSDEQLTAIFDKIREVGIQNLIKT